MNQIVRVDVDTQFGFCDPKGGLYVKDSERVIEEVARLNREVLVKHGRLIGSVDTHRPHDPEFKENGGLWPVHCVKGTQDWLKVPATLPEDFDFVPMDSKATGSDLVSILGRARALYFEKNSYSLMVNPAAKSTVAALFVAGFHTFEVYGVATDYCVSATALAIKALLPLATVRVLLYACDGVAKDTTDASIEQMKASGVEVVP